MVGCQGVPVPLAPRRVARADEPLEPEVPEPRREVAREAAPRRVVARQQHRFPAEGTRVVVEVGVHLRLDVVVLRVELIVLGRPRRRQVGVRHACPSLFFARCPSAPGQIYKFFGGCAAGNAQNSPRR